MDASEIYITMNDEGATIWSRLTRENIGRQIAIVSNNKVYSFPTVQCEITGGKSVITGLFSTEEATIMANILNAGSMPKIKVEVLSIK